MKSLTVPLSLVVLLGAVAAAVVWGAGFEADVRFSALVGVLAGSVLGLLALLVKLQLATRVTEGVAGLKALLAAQGLSFLLRLLALGAGLVGLRFHEGSSPIAFVLAFFAVSLGQQALEMKSLLTARNPVTS